MNENRVIVGEKYECMPRKCEKEIVFPFTGFVEKKYVNAAMIRIASSHVLDEAELEERKWRVIWPYKDIRELKE